MRTPLISGAILGEDEPGVESRGHASPLTRPISFVGALFSAAPIGAFLFLGFSAWATRRSASARGDTRALECCGCDIGVRALRLGAFA